MSSLLAFVFGSTCTKQISGELPPRSGRIFSHFRSERFLKTGASALASLTGELSIAAAGELGGDALAGPSGSWPRPLNPKPNIINATAKGNFVFIGQNQTGFTGLRG